MNILCIVPARSGSKSVPNKNIQLYKKKPLLAHAIDVAKQSKYRMRIVVSTDSQEYANIAIQYGAEAPFLRPLEISGDKSTSYDCVAHCVQYLEHNGYAPDIVVLLQPTSPTRTVEDLDTCLDIFLEKKDQYDSLFSVAPAPVCPFKMFRIQESTLLPLFKQIDDIQEPYNKCRQQLPETWISNGYFYIFKRSILENQTLMGSKCYPYKMTENIDIDTDKDFMELE